MKIKLIGSIAEFFLVAIISFALCACTMSQQTRKETTFFLEKANLELPQCLSADYRELEISCHRLYSGEKIAVASREYDSEPHMQSFKKWTVLLPSNAKTGDKFYVSKDDVTISYSYGFSFNPGKSGCFGIFEKGEIEVISKNENNISIRLSGDVTMKRPLNRGTACGFIKLEKSIAATYTKYENLSPWDGKINKGASLTEETYPH